jgi:hypothetical protein
VYGKLFEETSNIEELFDLNDLAMGVYNVFVQKENGEVSVGRFVKASN